jgi:predicted dehydrogenase
LKGQCVLKKVRVGIIGPSWWVDYWHLPAILNHPDAEIVALCSARPRDAAEVSAKYGQGRDIPVFKDIVTMLNEVQIDGVVVCTPNDVHHPATMAALNHAVHVTCEKPVALNAGQAREMAETAAAKSLIGMSNFPYRGNPAAIELRRQIASGFVGKLLHISGQYHGGFGLLRAPGWRGSRRQSGAGILGDLGSHLIDLARFAVQDEFAAVTSSSLTVLKQESGDLRRVRTEDPSVGDRNDDSCAFLAEFASGAQGIFHTSWLAYQGGYTQHQELEVYGSEGRLSFLSTHTGTHLKGIRVGEKRWEYFPIDAVTRFDEFGEDEEDFFRPGRHNATNTTYRWIDAIRDCKTTISPDLTDGLRAQLVIDAVIQAGKERRWVDVEAP